MSASITEVVKMPITQDEGAPTLSCGIWISPYEELPDEGATASIGRLQSCCMRRGVFHSFSMSQWHPTVRGTL
jgi:hypothetical protein